jgi:hypothetical protein
MTDLATVPTADIGNIVSTVINGVGVAVLTIVAAWTRAHLNNKQAQDTVLTAAENAVAYAENRLGVKSGQPYSVPVASAVGRMALGYVNAHVGDAAKQLGLDDAGISRIVVAKMPGIAAGGIDESTFNGIVASASGAAPAPADYSQLVAVLTPMLEQVAAKAIADHYVAGGKPTAAAPPAAA